MGVKRVRNESASKVADPRPLSSLFLARARNKMSIFADDDFVQGRKRIMEFLGVKSWRTVRRWKKRYGLDGLIMQLPNGQPVLMKSVIRMWFFRLNEILQEKKEKDSK
jgi:hypothetical protein